MKQSSVKIFSVVTAVMLLLSSAFAANAISIYEDGDYAFAEISDDSFVALHGFSKSVAEPVNVVIPDASMGNYVLSVYEYAFYENQFINTVDFSNARHLNYIDSRAFSKSTLSGAVNLPASLKTIGFAAFQECEGITSVTVGNKLSEIPAQCFNGCTALSSVTLSQNVTKLDKLSFANCPSLDYIFIPDSVTEIEDSAFNNSYNTVIYCYYDSCAYYFAKDKRISYVLLDGIKLGDTSGDGSVNINDVTTIQRYLAELETLEGIYLRAADANQDGTVDISDATALQMYIAEYDLPYPIGEVMTQ